MNKTYEIEDEFENGVKRKILLFEDAGQGFDEHRWIFRYNYIAKEGLEKPILINDINLFVNYKNGIAQKCNLTMNVIRPDKLGKEFFAGVDISPGSKLYLDFLYGKVNDKKYEMSEARIGNEIIERKDSSIDNKKEGLIKVMRINFPFPLKDTLEENLGYFEIPFLKKGGEEDFFRFPNNYEM